MGILIALILMITPTQAPSLIDFDNVPPIIRIMLPACEEEDGNQNGLPCIWDGKYYITSENYR